MNIRKLLILSAQIILLTILFAGCSGMLDVPVKRNPGVTTASVSGGYSVAMVSGTLDVTIVLDKKPTGGVTIPVSLNTTTYATIAISSVTFTPDNWYTPQTITITGSGYALPIGNQNLSVIFGTAVSSDPVYNGMYTPSISIIAIGNFPGITVSPTSGPCHIQIRNKRSRNADNVYRCAEYKTHKQRQCYRSACKQRHNSGHY